jgi:VWFA-related protein
MLRLLAAASAVCAAQESVPRDAAEVTQQETPVTFRERANMVQVPVVVRDSQGRAITNLEKPDFQVTDQGRRQIVTRFSVEKNKPVEAPLGTPGADPDSSAERREIATRFVLYLFDDVHLNASDLTRVREATIRHFEAALDRGTRAAIRTTSGRVQLDFTDNQAQLRETLLRIQPQITRMIDACPALSHYVADRIQNVLDRRALDSATEETLRCPEFQAMLADPNADPAVVREQAEAAAKTAALRTSSLGQSDARLALEALRNAILRLGSMPGSRGLVLLSPGFIANSLRQEESDVLDRAIRSNIAVNTLDARGLFNSSPSADAGERVVNPNDPGSRTQLQLEAASAAGAVLAELAAGTGGAFFRNNNNLDQGLRQLGSPPETYYVLGYSPQDIKPDGRYHLLRVSLLKGKGYTIQARHGYFAPLKGTDSESDAKQQIEEILFSREELRGIPVDLSTQFFKPDTGNAKLTVIARVDMRNLKFRKIEDRNNDTVFVLSGIFDTNGNYVRGIQRTVEMRLRDATLDELRGSGMSVRTTFDLAPGAYVVRLVVWDEEGKLITARNGVVEIPY